MQTVLITGANNGLGLSLVKIYLKYDFTVFACYKESKENLEKLKKDNEQNLYLFPMDISSSDMIKKAVSLINSRTEYIDILINNAGVFLKENNNELEELEFDDFPYTMEVNAFGPLKVTKESLPLIKKGNKKLIINISSEAGSIKNCERTKGFAYCMSKAALNMQSRILQNYLGPDGIKILAVHPGWLLTDMGGPRATVKPDDAAENIYKLSMKSWKKNDPVYLDHYGNILEW